MRKPEQQDSFQGGISSLIQVQYNLNDYLFPHEKSQYLQNLHFTEQQIYINAHKSELYKNDQKNEKMGKNIEKTSLNADKKYEKIEENLEKKLDKTDEFIQKHDRFQSARNKQLKYGNKKFNSNTHINNKSSPSEAQNTQNAQATTTPDEISNLTFGQCSQDGKNYLEIIQGGSILIGIVNLVLLFYIWCRMHFARTEFWGTYIMNLIWSILTISYTLESIQKVPQECEQIIMAQKAILVITVKKELESLIFGLMCPREFSTRQSNFASNLIFPYLYMSSGNFDGCSQGSQISSLIFEVIFIHSFVLVLGTAFNLALTCMKRNKGGQVFKFFVLLGMMVMIMVYLQNLGMGSSLNSKSPECTKARFVQKSYVLIAPFGMISMLLILLTIREDRGEKHRSNILDDYTKQVQHDDYVYNVAKVSEANPAQLLTMHQNQDKQMDLTRTYGTLFK